MRSLTAAAAFCCGVALSVAAVGAREVSGIRMAEVAAVAGKELRLNGMGLRKQRLLFKVYVIGLYLELPTRDAREAIAGNEVKSMVLVMLRDASREQFAQAVEEGIRRNSGPVMPALRRRLDVLKRVLPNLRKGAVLSFTYLPGIGTVVYGGGRQMLIQGKDFADALLSAWLGPNPLDGKLKHQLLGG